jgi:Family of unknown function (DUF6335)
MSKSPRKRAASRRTAAKAVSRRTRPARARKQVRKRVARKTTRTSPARPTTSRKPAARKIAKRAVTRKAAARKTPSATASRPAPAPKVSAPRASRAAASAPSKRPALDRERRRLPESDLVPTPPSSLDLDRSASAARSGQFEIRESLAEHTETGPEITAGDVDASWESAYSTGDEAPGGDNPTPDQDVVDDIGKSLGLEYEDNEELKGADKISERDKHRWELDPASSEDFEDR